MRVSDIIWFLPRPARLSIGGRSVLSLGGATSLDRAAREEGVTWWADEAITDAHVLAATAEGLVDVMFTHESPGGTSACPLSTPMRGLSALEVTPLLDETTICGLFAAPSVPEYGASHRRPAGEVRHTRGTAR